MLPGPIRTKRVKDYIEQMAKEENVSVKEIEEEFFVKDRHTSIIQRSIEPEEIVNLIAYFPSLLASATNGVALQVEGGVLKSAF